MGRRRDMIDDMQALAAQERAADAPIGEAEAQRRAEDAARKKRRGKWMEAIADLIGEVIEAIVDMFT